MCHAARAWSHSNGLGEPARDPDTYRRSACHADALCQPALAADAQHQPAANSCFVRADRVTYSRADANPAHTNEHGSFVVSHADRSHIAFVNGGIHSLGYAHVSAFRYSADCRRHADAHCVHRHTRFAHGDPRAHAASAAYAHPCAHSYARADHPADPGHDVVERPGSSTRR